MIAPVIRKGPMGSSIDGSMAAQGAPEADPDQSRSGGLFSRLFRKVASAEDEAQAGDVNGGATSGLGSLTRLRVDDVAIPKVEIVGVPDTITREELIEVFREHGFSRIPVYDGSLDQPLGVVTLKDFALTYGFGPGGGAFDLRGLLRPLIYVPPSMPLTVLLQKMQAERSHMALVIDEYGGVDGLATFEDIIETMVGDVLDEHDTVEGPQWVEEGPGVWLVEASASLSEIEEATGVRLRGDEDDGEIDTLGGLAYQRAGRVPVRGEVIALDGGAEIEVVDAERHRIKRLRLRRRGLEQTVEE